jgi:uncharacterized membrane protein
VTFTRSESEKSQTRDDWGAPYKPPLSRFYGKITHMSAHHFFESHGRSIAKTLTWKFVATIISFSITYYETRSIQYALKFSLIVLIIGLFAYYFHERAWNTIRWGKQHAEHSEV